MIKKILYSSVLLIIMMSSWLFSSTYAQCDACGQTPNELEKYLNTMDQLLTFEVPVEPYESKASPGEKLQRAAAAAQQDLDTYLAVLPIDDEEDYQESLEELMNSSRWRIRDYKKLEDIDGAISLKLKEIYLLEMLWKVPLVWEQQAGVFNNTLSSLWFVEFSRVNNTGFAIADQTYKVYLWMLRKLNAMMKHMHRDLYRHHDLLSDVGKWSLKAATNSPQDVFEAAEAEQLKLVYIALKYELWIPYIEKYDDTKIFTFTGKFIEDNGEYADLLIRVRELQRAYECSVWVRNLCESRSKTAEASRRMVVDRRQNDGKRASKTFNDARGRLKWALRHADAESEAASAKRQEQLMSQYRWDDFPQDRKRREVARVNYEEDEVAYSPTSLQWLLKTIFEKRAKWEGNQWTDNLGLWWSDTSTPPPDDSVASTTRNQRRADDKEKREALLEKHFYGSFDREEKEKRRNGELDMRDYFTSSTVEQEKRALYTTAMSVLDAQEAYDIQTLVYDVTEVTKQFPSLSYALYANANNRWDKSDDKNDPPIYVAAQQVCTNQCSNIQDKQCGGLWN